MPLLCLVVRGDLVKRMINAKKASVKTVTATNMKIMKTQPSGVSLPVPGLARPTCVIHFARPGNDHILEEPLLD